MKTIYRTGEAVFIEKKSRFISFVYSVANEDAAQKLIADTRKKYWDASHVVFAYRIGNASEVERMSDDGEPSGTAGMPTLDILRGEDIRGVLIMTVRYFGGTLLGTGGLVRAYQQSAKEALQEAVIIEKQLYRSFTVILDYGLLGKVQYEALQNNFRIHETLYAEHVTCVFLIQVERVTSFLKKLTDLTNATLSLENGTIVAGEELYCAECAQDFIVFNMD